MGLIVSVLVLAGGLPFVMEWMERTMDLPPKNDDRAPDVRHRAG